MTQKELLYIEDAIGHENSLFCICEEILDSLSDKKLRLFMEKEKKKHATLRDKYLSLLEDCANE